MAAPTVEELAEVLRETTDLLLESEACNPDRLDDCGSCEIQRFQDRECVLARQAHSLITRAGIPLKGGTFEREDG